MTTDTPGPEPEVTSIELLDSEHLSDQDHLLAARAHIDAVIEKVRPERPEFPVDGYEDVCPACGADERNLQLSEETTRYWRGFSVEDDTVFVYDDTTYDDGDDAHISCIVCLAEWAVPEDLTYG